jgi:hypothetical protein
MLSVLELFIAVMLILKMFGENGVFAGIAEDYASCADWFGRGTDSIVDISEIRGPTAALALIAGFMVFGYVLITVLPKLVDKREKEIEADELDSE